MSSIPFNMPHSPGGGIGTYFKVAALPSNPMTIWDLSFGASGYQRCYLNSAGIVHIETSLNGSHTDFATTSTAVIPGQWYWVHAFLGWTDDANGQSFVQWDLWTGGVQIGTGSPVAICGLFGGTYSAVVGFGASTSSAYEGFPNAAGYELSKMAVWTLYPTGYAFPGEFDMGHYRSPANPPSADWSASNGNPTAYWNCRDTIGPQPTIGDGSGNNYNLAAGPNGMVVVSNGPYA